MTQVAILLSLAIAAMGAIGIVSPDTMLQIGRPFETLYGSTAVHLILGGALVLAAPRSRAPRALLVVGLGSFVTGLLELFLGVPLGRAGHDWSVAQGDAFLRICAVFILALGSGFTFLLWPRSSTA